MELRESFRAYHQNYDWRSIMTSELPPQARAIMGMLRSISPRIPGKSRIARLLLKPQLSLHDILLRDRNGIMYAVPSLREPIGFHLLVDGLYEPNTMKLLQKTLTRGSVFVDIGANIGAFAIPAASLVGPTGRVLAIE